MEYRVFIKPLQYIINHDKNTLCFVQLTILANDDLKMGCENVKLFLREPLGATSMSLRFSAKIRFSQNQVHHRGTEGTEREIYFFVHREIPMDEKRAPNQTYVTAFFMVQHSKTLDQEEFWSRCFKCRGIWTALFYLSVSPRQTKTLSLCSLCLCGEFPFWTGMG
jgi:hypothetical protein